MKQEYKRIRTALCQQSSRFKKKQTMVFLLFFLKVAVAELLIAAFAVGAFFLAPASVYAFIIVGIAVFCYLLKKSKLICCSFLRTVFEN